MNGIRKLRTGIVLALLSLSCFRTGLPVKRFSSHETAGSIAVSIQSIAPFDEQYIEQLQPKSELPATAAAIAQTQIRQIQQLRALLVQAGLGLPSSTVEQTKTTTDKPDDKKFEFERTETTTPPSLDKLPTAPAVDTTLPEALALVDNTLALDTALNIRARAALQQEIALLNRYVRDAAVSRGTRPYVVRLLVTLSPSARFEPYDAYTAISLFSSTPVKEPLPFFYDGQKDAILRPVVQTAASSTCGRGIEVIPLFVTDNIESSLDSIAGKRAIGVQGAVSGIVQNVGGNIGTNFQSQDIEKAQARLLNSLQTISRLAGNTVETRFGAMNAAGGYQMLARTYNVTVLALMPTLRGYLDSQTPTKKEEEKTPSERAIVEMATGLETLTATLRNAYGDPKTRPESGDADRDAKTVQEAADEILLCQNVAFSALSRFVDTDSGVTLRSHFDGMSASHLQELARHWGIGLDKIDTLKRLLTYAQFDSYDEFRSHIANNALGRVDLDGPNPRLDAMGTFWLDFVAIARSSGRYYGRFALPQDGFQFFASDRATLFDDGKAATVTLVGSKNLTSTALEGSLIVNGRDLLTDSAVAVSADGRRAKFTFLSPAKLLSFNTSGGAAQTLTSLKLSVRRGGGSKPFEPQIIRAWSAEMPASARGNVLTYVRIPEEPKDETAKVTMDVTAPHVVITTADAGGLFAVSFRSDPDEKLKVRFNVDGGYIVATDPATLPKDADRLGDGNQTYIITVKNLSQGDKLTVRAFQAKADGTRGLAITPKIIDVLAQAETTEPRRVVIP